MNNKKVSIINSNSCFRGLIGAVVRITANGMYEVKFDTPFHNHTSAVFFGHEIKEIK